MTFLLLAAFIAGAGAGVLLVALMAIAGRESDAQERRERREDIRKNLA